MNYYINENNRPSKEKDDAPAWILGIFLGFTTWLAIILTVIAYCLFYKERFPKPHPISLINYFILTSILILGWAWYLLDIKSIKKIASILGITLPFALIAVIALFFPLFWGLALQLFYAAMACLLAGFLYLLWLIGCFLWSKLLFLSNKKNIEPPKLKRMYDLAFKKRTRYIACMSLIGVEYLFLPLILLLVVLGFFSKAFSGWG